VHLDELLSTICGIMSRFPADGQVPSGSSAATVRGAVIYSALKPLRVLVAEDADFNAQLMEKLLTHRGFSVRLAKNGREALELASVDSFDLLLLDVHMPEMDGFEVIRAIRQREKSAGSHLPVIAMTAGSRPDERQLCLDAGMDAFLVKPTPADGLWATIDRLFGATPASGPVTSELLDARVLLAACGEEDEILRSICEGLRRSLPTELAIVREFLEEGKMSSLRASAHKLSGMVAAFSTAAGQVASDLEKASAQEELAVARALAERLVTMCDQLLQTVAGDVSVQSLRASSGH
jgi:two-component system sensor histidine kinase/response regulator